MIKSKVYIHSLNLHLLDLMQELNDLKEICQNKEVQVDIIGFVGPGAYNVTSGNQQKGKARKALCTEWQQMVMVKLPYAPSIPSHNNVFGYEETSSIN